MAAQFKTKANDVSIKREVNSDAGQAKDDPQLNKQDSNGSKPIKHESPSAHNRTNQDAAMGASDQVPVGKGQTPQELKDLGMSGDIFGDGLASAGFNEMSTDVDFDSMFGDSGGNPTDSLNFDLDFSGNNPAGDGHLVGANGHGPTASTTEMGNLDATSSEDINSLLPGLESLVNADGEGGIDDFTMLDVPAAEKTNTTTTSTSGQPQTTSATSQNALPVSATGDANNMDLDAAFDDLIGPDSMDFGGTGEVNNIDFDEWFN